MVQLWQHSQLILDIFRRWIVSQGKNSPQKEWVMAMTDWLVLFAINSGLLPSDSWLKHRWIKTFLFGFWFRETFLIFRSSVIAVGSEAEIEKMSFSPSPCHHGKKQWPRRSLSLPKEDRSEDSLLSSRALLLTPAVGLHEEWHREFLKTHSLAPWEESCQSVVAVALDWWHMQLSTEQLPVY